MSIAEESAEPCGLVTRTPDVKIQRRDLNKPWSPLAGTYRLEDQHQSSIRGNHRMRMALLTVGRGDQDRVRRKLQVGELAVPPLQGRT